MNEIKKELVEDVDLSKITFMDYKTLMIGDWVKCYHPTGKPQPIKVTASLLCLLERQDDGLVKFSEPIFRIVEPIEITHEILEKNGYHNGALDYFIARGIHCNVDLKHIMFGCECVNALEIKCEYVHEFQHALKLCGIEKEIVL